MVAFITEVYINLKKGRVTQLSWERIAEALAEAILTQESCDIRPFSYLMYTTKNTDDRGCLQNDRLLF